MKRQKNLTVIGLTICSALLLVMLSLVLPVQGAALDATATPTAGDNACKPIITGKVVTDQLIVRVAPVTTAQPVIFITRDDIITVLGQDNNGDWLYIMTNSGKPGWGASPYILVDKKKLPDIPKLGAVNDLINAAATAAPTQAATADASLPSIWCTPTPSRGPLDGTVVSAGAMDIKAQPLNSAKVLGTVKRDDKVRVLAYNAAETWIKIQAGDIVGWVSSAYVFVPKPLQPQIPHDFIPAEVTLTPSPTPKP